MKKMIGKSGVDWSEAPEGTTHYKSGLFYRYSSVWECHNNYWLKSSNVDSWFNDAVSKDEDLISSIEDDYQGSGVERVDFSGFDYHSHYSETYNGGYTPIVKETEAEIKIKELEATIALAQKQLQEYKGMK